MINKTDSTVVFVILGFTIIAAILAAAFVHSELLWLFICLLIIDIPLIIYSHYKKKKEG